MASWSTLKTQDRLKGVDRNSEILPEIIEHAGSNLGRVSDPRVHLSSIKAQLL